MDKNELLDWYDKKLTEKDYENARLRWALQRVSELSFKGMDLISDHEYKIYYMEQINDQLRSVDNE